MIQFNPERLMAIGEGLAAGFGAFSLNRFSQRNSFPALIAQQLGVAFPQPLFEPPGIGNAPGYEPQPVILPGISQATVFERLPPIEFANLSVPGFTLTDAIKRLPRQPYIVRDDAVQTACNLILGGRRLATNSPLHTQVQAAAVGNPSAVIVCLGFTEALHAAIGDRTQGAFPEAEPFAAAYACIVSGLRPASLMLCTVPDPFDIPFFASPAHAARILRVEESWLCEYYRLNPNDALKMPAVHEVGFQIFGKSLAPLPADATVRSARIGEVTSRVESWNWQIRSLAASHGALVCDLHRITKRLRTEGVRVGTRHLTADYLGGLYTLNGYYFGHLGHALIANEVLGMLNEPAIDLEEILAHAPGAQASPAKGRLWSSRELSAMQQDKGGNHPRTGQNRTSGGLPPLNPLRATRLPAKLVLPPGLKQDITLDHHGSYFGDGIAAANCEDAADAQYGGGGFNLFGGLALVHSHLTGALTFCFTPVNETRATFTLRFGDLSGDDAILAAPIMFRMPFQRCGVSAYPAPFDVSTGEVDLLSGEVSQLRLYADFQAVALQALVASNLGFPKDPLSFVTLDAARSPLEYSSAWARFDQRPDGKLDFTFYGTRFVPLGAGARWPLNFCGPDGEVALIPASGTVMHPHLRLSTKSALPDSHSNDTHAVQPWPLNSVKELTFHTHNSAFGDGFDLRIPQLGGPSTGRSHLLGRLSVQFGLPSGGTVPVAIRTLPPGGVFVEPPPSPISDSFPIRVPPGPRGFDQRLRYPRATYTMEDISIPDDPFDFALGAMDCETGCLFSDHVHRGFIEQDVINALMRIEPRARHTSFFFRGPGIFSRTRSNALVFRFLGEELLPYPAGLAFPQPDFTTSYYAGPGSTLKPYFWIRAVEDEPPLDLVAEGSYRNVEAAGHGDRFSFEYRIPADPGRRRYYFRFKNDTQLGSFQLHTISWVGFGNALESKKSATGFDLVTFSGFGVWEKNTIRSLEQVTAQIWKSADCKAPPYIGIQIGSGDICNVDTRPLDPLTALP